MLQWMQRQHESLGPIPTTSVRDEVCRRKGKIMGDKTWQTWVQDFRSFFPEVTLNVANKWTNSNVFCGQFNPGGDGFSYVKSILLVREPSPLA